MTMILRCSVRLPFRERSQPSSIKTHKSSPTSPTSLSLTQEHYLTLVTSVLTGVIFPLWSGYPAADWWLLKSQTLIMQISSYNYSFKNMI